MPVILTIAGSDSGAGAGVQADARTIHALGGYALTAIAAVTAQNTRGVRAWRATPPALLAAQIEAVLEDCEVGAIKTGLLPGAAVRTVAATLARWPGIPLVVDPVLGSTSGTRFLSPAGLKALRGELLPRATLVTPNWPEAAALAGTSVTSFAEAEAAGRLIVERHGCAALAKGGHAPRGKVCRDCLVTPDGRVRWFEGPRVATRNTHGTGCVLSAAIATGLARGDRLETAVQRARDFLGRALVAGRSERLGGGAGPAFSGVRKV